VKYCSDCKQTKPIGEFGISRHRKDGRTLHCKDCTNRKSRENKKKHVEKNTDYNRKYRSENREAYREWERQNYQSRKEERLASAKKWRHTESGSSRLLHLSAQRRAKKKGIPYELTPEIILNLMRLQEGKCALTGVQFEFGESSFYFRPLAPSIDKIDATKGYTIGNVQITTVVANKAKNEYPIEIFDQMCAGRLKVLGQ
jgi:hypothetical protein